MARRKANTDVEVDMTPMIDMTFLLIIFFIIVNDLTQQELEELKLPIAEEAGHDDPPPGRPILNVMPNGDIIWKKNKLYFDGIDSRGRIDPIRPGRPDYYWQLADTLRDRIIRNGDGMTIKFDEGLQKDLVDDPILIRADRNTPFKYIQRIMEVCTREGILIWKVQLAASEPEK